MAYLIIGVIRNVFPAQGLVAAGVNALIHTENSEVGVDAASTVLQSGGGAQVQIRNSEARIFGLFSVFSANI